MWTQSIGLACVSVECRSWPELLAVAALRLWRQAGTTMSHVHRVLHVNRASKWNVCLYCSQIEPFIVAHKNSVDALLKLLFHSTDFHLQHSLRCLYLLFVSLMPGPCVTIGTAFASAGKSVPTTLVLVEILVADF